MTLREWLDTYTHNGDAQLVCAWRKRAWRAMRPVVEKFVADRDAGLSVSAASLLEAIDAAGVASRIEPGSKRWEQERSRLVRIVMNRRELQREPTADEYAICEVAIDLVEMDRLDEARQLLEQAPHRLAARCPACGAYPGDACFDVVEKTRRMRLACLWLGIPVMDADEHYHARIDRLVPHLSRVQPRGPQGGGG